MAVLEPLSRWSLLSMMRRVKASDVNTGIGGMICILVTLTDLNVLSCLFLFIRWIILYPDLSRAVDV